MMLGVIASQLAADVSASSIGIEMDFKLENYTSGGVAVALEDLMTHTDRVVPGSGLGFTADATHEGRTNLIGDAIDFLAATENEFSVIVHVFLDVATTNLSLFLAWGGLFNDYIELFTSSSSPSFRDEHSFFDENPNDAREENDAKYVLPGGQLAKIGLTRRNGSYLVSVNGETAFNTTEDLVGLVPMTSIELAVLTGVGDISTTFIEYLEIVPPLPENTLNARTLVEDAPSNDDFANAQSITTGVVTEGWTFFATRQSGEPNHAGDTNYTSSVWFDFVAPASTNYTITVGGPMSPNWIDIGVYTGSSVGALSEVASNLNPPFDEVTFAATMDTTYRIAIAAYDDQYHGGYFTIEIT